MAEKNVLGGELEPCSHDPVTGWFRDGSCRTDERDRGSHTICVVVTDPFLEHQKTVGNNLSDPVPRFGFPGLKPGDRWCVTAANWLRAYAEGAAAPVVMASTHIGALDIVPMESLRRNAIDVPDDPSALEG